MKNRVLLLILISFSQFLRAETILLLGDSSCFGNFADKIFDTINATEDQRIAIYGGSGFTALDWLKEPAYSDDAYKYKSASSKSWTLIRIGHVEGIQSLMAKFKPTTVVLQLGGNMYSILKDFKNPMNNERAVSQIREIKRVILGTGPRPRKCLWITPPYTTQVSLEKQNTLDTLTEKIFKPECEVYRSYEPMLAYYSGTKERATDHPSNSAYAHWASLVIPKILALSRQ